MNNPRYAINYRQLAKTGYQLSATTHVLDCATRQEADLYATIIEADESISHALLIDRAAAGKVIHRIKPGA